VELLLENGEVGTQRVRIELLGSAHGHPVRLPR
jgi:hypothetical protein